MVSAIPNITLRFFFLVLLQALVLNNVAFNGFINPYLYVLFILMLPFETPKWLTLVSGFILGFTIDIFTNTLGMHLSASIFLAYSREYVLRLISPREGYDATSSPTISDMGIAWFVTYCSILVLLHHIFLFFVEAFRFTEFFTILWRAILSSFFTLLLIFIGQLFVYRKKAER